MYENQLKDEFLKNNTGFFPQALMLKSLSFTITDDVFNYLFCLVH